MIIRITNNYISDYVRSEKFKIDDVSAFEKKLHKEIYEVTTVWILFIPIFRKYRLVSDVTIKHRKDE